VCDVPDTGRLVIEVLVYAQFLEGIGGFRVVGALGHRTGTDASAVEGMLRTQRRDPA
jgi:hypothetical protein